MSTAVCVFFAMSVTLVAGIDLGPSIRIAQCRSLCLRRHQEISDCKSTPDCFMCWETCSLLENDWTIWGSVCQDDEEICFPGCKSACAYHATRVEEELAPSSLPAPLKGPATPSSHEVAIIFRRTNEEWREVEQRSGVETLPLNRTTWVVVIGEEGARQYSGDFWKPNLQTLKEGALFEASLSWGEDDLPKKNQDPEDPEDPEQREIDNDIAKLNTKMAIDFGSEEDSAPSVKKEAEERFRAKSKVYFAFETAKYFDEKNVRILADASPEVGYWNGKRASGVGEDVEEATMEGRPEIYKEEPSLVETTSRNTNEESGRAEYIVSWEPETGGLMGNQLTDARSTQISLLPGTKYLVRIASNDGPGSFALEIDTTTKSVEYAPLGAIPVNVHPWAILAGCMSAVVFMSAAVVMKICMRSKIEEKLEHV